MYAQKFRTRLKVAPIRAVLAYDKRVMALESIQSLVEHDSVLVASLLPNWVGIE
jgi:hypothetical protein